mmetsp:Transcript_106871/g.312426  ORF Transcript_106871/g.312426 Transcript_106871/m.312426 type:complete len:249 (-) Transcript_106871:27-773(-)
MCIQRLNVACFVWKRVSVHDRPLIAVVYNGIEHSRLIGRQKLLHRLPDTDGVVPPSALDKRGVGCQGVVVLHNVPEIAMPLAAVILQLNQRVSALGRRALGHPFNLLRTALVLVVLEVNGRGDVPVQKPLGPLAEVCHHELYIRNWSSSRCRYHLRCRSSGLRQIHDRVHARHWVPCSGGRGRRPSAGGGGGKQLLRVVAQGELLLEVQGSEACAGDEHQRALEAHACTDRHGAGCQAKAATIAWGVP